VAPRETTANSTTMKTIFIAMPIFSIFSTPTGLIPGLVASGAKIGGFG
jgi:hypothetical protein